MATQTLLLSKRIVSEPPSSLRRQPVYESIIREQVLSTHNYDGRQFNTNFILSVAENILRFKMDTTEEGIVETTLNKVEELNNYEQLPYHIIREVSFEIASGLKASSANHHSTTINVLSMLSCYCWEDKLVLMLAAFSIIYGGFSLVCPSSRIHKRKLGLALNLADTQKAVVDDCMSSVIELIKCVVELIRPSPSYSPPQSSIWALPMAAYWIATSLISISAACACAPGVHFKVHQTELVELTALTTKMLATFSTELAKKKAEESFQKLRHALHHNSSNRVEVFRLIFNVKNDDEEIFRYNSGLNEWENDRTVLLLITSSFDISKEWIDFLDWLYSLSEPYIIWIPITQNNASWTTEDKQQFAKLKERISYFYWLEDPELSLRPQFIRFVKEELFTEFQMGWGEDPILVSVDLRGRIVHPNVMNMILTWGFNYIEKNTIGVQRLYNITPLIEKEVKEGTSGVNRVVPEIDEMISDFLGDIDDMINAWTHLVERRIQQVMEQSTPYHSEREKELWQQETAWSLHLLAQKFGSYQKISVQINDWIQEGKYIFLYGGNNMKWVREFTSKVHEVGSKAQLSLELAYVGKNKMIRRIIDKERMSRCPLYNSTRVWWFWSRLRSMFLSRTRYLDVSNYPVEEHNNDEILQGLKKLLAYESKNTRIEGWALLSKGSEVIVCGHGAKMLQAMNDYQIWKENIAPKSFGQAFKDHHDMLSLNSHSCCTIEYSIILNKIPETEKCFECSRMMHKFLTFSCCHGHDFDSDIDECY